jgi:chromosome partitioning protein
MRVVAIVNPKGGTAKSTSSVNLAAIAAGQGVNTLLIDLDPQGSASYILGQSKDLARSAAELFADEPAAPTALAIDTDYGFALVPAGSGLIGAEDTVSRAALGELRLARALEQDPGLARFDLVLMDTAGYNGRLFTSALIACDEILIPVRPSSLSANELPDLLATVHTLSSYRSKPPIRVRGVFFADVQEGTTATNLNIQEVSEGLNEFKIAQVLIPRTTSVEEAALLRKPVVEYDPACKATQRYRELYFELLGDLSS